MKDYEKISDLTFNEILDVKFDFKQREFLTAPFLQQSIIRLAEEKNTDVNEMSSVIVTKDSDANKVYMFFHDETMLREMDLDYICPCLGCHLRNHGHYLLQQGLISI